jgi:plasmid stabilization system protein ParE
MVYKLRWSEESIRNLEEILDYLSKKWTKKESDNFKLMLSKQLDIIIQFPLIFPKSDFTPRLRKAVLSKQITVYYEFNSDVIYLAYIFINKKNINQIK